MKILFFGQGFLRSALGARPVNASGEPIPWLTYPAIEYLKQFDFSDKRIFEYGAGNSSLFWAQRAKEVWAVESDRRWFEQVSRLRPSNLFLHLETVRDDYVSSIGRAGVKFDVIVIDGQWRNACAGVCTRHLADHGIIVFDNSDRRYEGCDRLRAQGFFQIDFSGFSPVSGYASTTSVFIRAPTPLQSGFSPPQPVGGLGERAGDDD
ncbi:MAG: hypothetical protein ACK4N4_05090 [Burkholderiales bacterium]